jgi:DNA invertase Pin-like site-specific DNA recombinase
MSGKIIGYVRVSTFDQNPERQLEGIPVDRPAFEELMAYVREGDQVIIHSMDRLARNLDHLRQVVNRLTTQGISVRFLKENLTFTGQDSPMANLMLSVMGAMAEFERSLIRERQREGVQIAKAKGLYKGRKKSLSQEQLSELQKRIAEGEKKASLARHFNITRETLYQYVKLSPTLAIV